MQRMVTGNFVTQGKVTMLTITVMRERLVQVLDVTDAWSIVDPTQFLSEIKNLKSKFIRHPWLLDGRLSYVPSLSDEVRILTFLAGLDT
jgi:hypothetical protein